MNFNIQWRPQKIYRELVLMCSLHNSKKSTFSVCNCCTHKIPYRIVYKLVTGRYNNYILVIVANRRFEMESKNIFQLIVFRFP